MDPLAGSAWSTPGRVAVCLRHASLPRAISAHIMLAFLNIGVAATLGMLIGFDKVYHFLPGFVLANVFAQVVWQELAFVLWLFGFCL